MLARSTSVFIAFSLDACRIDLLVGRPAFVPNRLRYSRNTASSYAGHIMTAPMHAAQGHHKSHTVLSRHLASYSRHPELATADRE